MRTLLFALLLILISRVESEGNLHFEEIVEDEEIKQLVKFLNYLFPDSPDVDLATALINEDDVRVYTQVFGRQNYTNLNEILEALKTADASRYAKIHPLYEKNRVAYQSLTGDAKIFMDQLLEKIWSNLFIGYEEGKSKFLTKAQAKDLESKFSNLTDAERSTVKTKFPMLSYLIGSFGIDDSEIEDAQETEMRLVELYDELDRSGLMSQIFDENPGNTTICKLLESLKEKNATMHAKIQPLVQKILNAYEALSDEGKAFIVEYFKAINRNLRLLIDEEVKEMLTKRQAKQLKEKFDGLNDDQRKLIKTRFPVLSRYLCMKQKD